jgi:hypothetical protein
MVVAFLIVLLLLAAVVGIVASPWRRSPGPAPHTTTDAVRAAGADVAELEAARDAKYREIRDAQLDHETGKMSDEDFRAVDTALRAEAVDILRDLDRSRARLEKLRAAAAAPDHRGGRGDDRRDDSDDRDAAPPQATGVDREPDPAVSGAEEDW